MRESSTIEQRNMDRGIDRQSVSPVIVSFEFTVFLYCVSNLTCILGSLDLQMSSRTCMSKMRSCVVKDSWKMVDVSQVMIDHTIICKIHTSRLSTYVWNELSWRWRCTEILSFLSMKLELLSPLLSDSPFLSSKSFFMFFRFSMFKTQKSRPMYILPCFLRVKYSK